MKNILATILALLSLNGWACPQVDLTDLTCTFSDGSQTTLEKFSIVGTTMTVELAGSLESTNLPHDEVEGTMSSSTYCDGNRLTVVESLEDVITVKYMTINNGTLRIHGEEIVPACSYPEGCNANEYWLDSVQDVDFTCQ